MDLKELETTDIWKLYQDMVSYNNQLNVYSDTDKNYRMYNGNQWVSDFKQNSVFVYQNTNDGDIFRFT